MDSPHGSDSRARGRRPPRSITSAIRWIVVPVLRERGFTGELPHLRRATPGGTSTFSVQISKWGGKFIVELGRAPAGPYASAGGETIEPGALTSFDLRLALRARVRAVPDVLEEVWFAYTPTAGERVRRALRSLLPLQEDSTPFERAARELIALLPECERWWAGESWLPHVRSYEEQEWAQRAGKWPPPEAPRPEG